MDVYHVCAYVDQSGIKTAGLNDSINVKRDLPYNAVTYVCGCCGNHFPAICGLHEHLLAHEAGGSYHYDHLLRTAFPKYDTQCNSTQTVHGSERKHIMRQLEKLRGNTLKLKIPTKNTPNDNEQSNGTFTDRNKRSVDFHREVDIVVKDEDDRVVNVELKDTTQDRNIPCLKECRVLLDRITQLDSEKAHPADKNGVDASDNLKGNDLEPTPDLLLDNEFEEDADEIDDTEQDCEIGNSFTTGHDTERMVNIKTEEAGVGNESHHINTTKAFNKNNNTGNKSVVKNLTVEDDNKTIETIKDIIKVRSSKRKKKTFCYKDNDYEWETSELSEDTRDNAKETIKKNKIKKEPSVLDNDWDHLEENQVKEKKKKKQKTKKVVADLKQESGERQTAVDTAIIEAWEDNEQGGAVKINKKYVKKCIVCYICGASIKKEKTAYNEHIAEHRGDATLPCTMCEKKFTTKSKLRRHMTWHKEHKAFQCEICAVQCSSLFTLKTHTYIHTGESPFKCTQCPMAFKTSGKRLRHMNNIHLKIRHHRCPTCGKGFKDRNNLTEHIMTHTPGSFACRVCDGRFNSRKSRIRHEWIHKTDKPIHCHLCGHSFIQRYPYWTHMEKKHGLSRDEVKVILEARKQEKESTASTQ